mmetsp:Transcript_1036/g.2303  ORF Transcript_1036/g.2303 Transcript_1036/m.2303 type:complete len:180 (-) Transcript_1036:154-693(-)
MKVQGSSVRWLRCAIPGVYHFSKPDQKDLASFTVLESRAMCCCFDWNLDNPCLFAFVGGEVAKQLSNILVGIVKATIILSSPEQAEFSLLLPKPDQSHIAPLGFHPLHPKEFGYEHIQKTFVDNARTSCTVIAEKLARPRCRPKYWHFKAWISNNPMKFSQFILLPATAIRIKCAKSTI